MKIVVNKQYGSFMLSNEAAQILGVSPWCSDNAFRRSKKLIGLIEQNGSDFVSGRVANLVIVDIPDEATDYEIDEYDGWEKVIYVLDGKIHYA